MNRKAYDRKDRGPTLLIGALTLVLTCAAGLPWEAPALAQTRAAPERPTSLFGDVVDVRVVNIEVVATKKGERVSGLVANDFILTVDGKEVPIEYFTEVFGGASVERGDEGASGSLPALAPGTPVGTSYLLFIDEYFTVGPERDRVLRRMLEQLPVMNPEDRMAVVAFNGKKLEMLSTWSQSIPALTRVFEDAMERPAYGLQRRSEYRSFELDRDLRNQARPGTQTGSRLNDPFFDIEEEQAAEVLADHVRRASLAATSALRGFANPPGRKVMLLLSGGWPFNPALWVTGDFNAGYLYTTVDFGDDLLGNLAETANRLSYTIYPVDIPHRSTTDIIDASRQSIGGQIDTLTTEIDTGINTGTGFGIDTQRDLLFDRQQDEYATLNYLAQETGGRPLYGAASYAALERTAADTRTYYWLGFTPQWRGDDESHKIRVKARDKSIKIRSREGFSDLSRQTEVSMMVESSLLFGDAPSSRPLYAETGPSVKAGMGKIEVPITVIIPVSELSFLPLEGQYVAETELRLAVLDEYGNTSDVPIVPMAITLDAPPEEGDLRRYDTRIRMRKRKHDLVVSLYDNASGKILATRLAVEPATGEKKKKKKKDR